MAATSEYQELEKELICSQEENSGTHHSIRRIASELSVSQTSVHCMVKRKDFLLCIKV